MIVAIIMAVILAGLISWIWASLIARAYEEYPEYKGEALFGEIDEEISNN